MSYIDSLGAGFVTQSQSYDPWSNVNAGSEYSFNGVNTDKFLVSAREQDTETGNVLLDWRNYNSVLGRLNSYDPEDPSPMLSGYAYAGNNPVSVVDPDGREPITIGTAILIGALIGGGTNVATQVIQNKGFNNFNWQSFGLSTLAGGVSGASSFGIGSAFKGAVGFEKVIGSAYAHAFSGAAQSALFGGDPIQGFASGAFGSLAGSAMGDNPSALLAGLGGGVSGAFGAYITGGKVGPGFAMGASVGLLNDWAHKQIENLRGEKIADLAKKYVNSTKWALLTSNGDFGPGDYKCNLFVSDVLNEAGAGAGFPHEAGFLGKILGHGPYPPSAGNWGDSNFKIENWKVLKANQLPRAGDVVSIPHDSINASGHVGIVYNRNTTISATQKSVVSNNWGFREGQKPVFRRYVGK